MGGATWAGAVAYGAVADGAVVMAADGAAVVMVAVAGMVAECLCLRAEQT